MNHHTISARIVTAVITIFIVHIFLVAEGANAIPVTEWNGHFYALTTQRYGWQDAENEAVSLGGHLISINSAAEQVAVNDFLATEPQYLALNNRFLPNIFWIGLWDGLIDGIADRNNWKWTDGSSLTYTNWAPGEPSSIWPEEENVVVNWYDSGFPNEYGRWNDIDSPYVERADRWNGAFGIMEFETDPNDIPEPATVALLASGIVGMVARKRKLL